MEGVDGRRSKTMIIDSTISRVLCYLAMEAQASRIAETVMFQRERRGKQSLINIKESMSAIR